MPISPLFECFWSAEGVRRRYLCSRDKKAGFRNVGKRYQLGSLAKEGRVWSLLNFGTLRGNCGCGGFGSGGDLGRWCQVAGLEGGTGRPFRGRRGRRGRRGDGGEWGRTYVDMVVGAAVEGGEG